MRLPVLLSAVVLSLLSAAPAWSQPFASPGELMKAIYQPMMAGQFHADEQVFFSAATRERWDALMADDPAGIGFSPLVDGQDADLANFAILSAEETSETAEIVVTFTNFGAPRVLLFDLVRDPEGWAVEDITSTEEPRWQLSALLAD